MEDDILYGADSGLLGLLSDVDPDVAAVVLTGDEIPAEFIDELAEEDAV